MVLVNNAAALTALSVRQTVCNSIWMHLQYQIVKVQPIVCFHTASGH